MKTKKIMLWLLLAAFIVAQLCGLTACNDLPDNSAGVTITLVVLDLNSEKLYEKQITTIKSSLYEVFNEFEGIQVDSTSSFLGAYVSAVAIGKISENEYGKYFSQEARIAGGFEGGSYLYIGVFHDLNIENLIDASPYAASLQYAGKTYFYSAVGVSMLPLHDGGTYILKLTA